MCHWISVRGVVLPREHVPVPCVTSAFGLTSSPVASFALAPYVR